VPEHWKEVEELQAHAAELDLVARDQLVGEFLPYPKFLAGYFTGLIGGIGLAVGGKAVFGIDPYGTIFVVGGLVYLVAAAQRPRIVYLVLRNVGWFRSIDSIRTLRWIMFLLGLLLLAVGLLLHFRWLFSGGWL